MKPEGIALVQKIEKELRQNHNKISFDFIQRISNNSTGTYHQLSDNTRVCVLRLDTGHEVVGYARVLDKKNDDPAIGNKVALDNATDELWSLIGTIAKLFIKEA